MARLNERYHDTAGPTDVLTFDLGTDHRAGLVDGEIIVCADVARLRMQRAACSGRAGTMSAVKCRSAPGPSMAPRTAPSLLRGARRELALYVVHGILHLSSYNDATARAARHMHDREDEILSACGIGRVYRA